MTTLPDKPSALIRLALDDLEVIQKTPGYEINMETWHTPIKKKCAICFAGSVMARTLESIRMDQVCPMDFDRPTEFKLIAIDYFRMGDCGGAFSAMGLDLEVGREYNCDTPEFVGKGNEFKEVMRKLADDLKAGGY